MLLIFKKNKKTLKTISLQNYAIDNIIFGSDRVKEIAFSCTINNSDELKLQSLYREIQQINYLDCDEIIVYYNSKHYYSFNAQIKEVLYRTCSYMGNRLYELQENLSIRFKEDNDYIFDEQSNLIFCNKNCNYFSNKKCTKYDEQLLLKNNNYLVCKKCFIENDLNIKYKTFEQIYENMLKYFDNDTKNLTLGGENNV